MAADDEAAGEQRDENQAQMIHDFSSHWRPANICKHCGISVRTPTDRISHEQTHGRDFLEYPYICSICCTCCKTQQQRARHEIKSHNYKRHKLNVGKHETIRVLKSQLIDVWNVGTKLRDTQKNAVSSGAISEDSLEEEASDAELAELVQTKRHRPPPTEPCPHCGLNTFTNLHGLELHIEAHARAEGFMCTLCGIRLYDAFQRNVHERHVHGFHRHKRDKSCEEAIQIMTPSGDFISSTPTLLNKWREFISNPGCTNIKKTQETAVPSQHSPNDPIMDWTAPEKPDRTKKKGKRPAPSTSTSRAKRPCPSSYTSSDPEEEDGYQADSSNDSNDEESSSSEFDDDDSLPPPDIPAAYDEQMASDVELPADLHLPSVEAAARTSLMPSTSTAAPIQSVVQPADHPTNKQLKRQMKEQGRRYASLVGKLDRRIARQQEAEEKLAAEMTDWKTKTEAHELQIGELKSANGALELAINSSKSTVARLESDCEASRKKASDAEKAAVEERARLKMENAELKAKLNEQESRSSSRIAKLEAQNLEQQREAEKTAAEWAQKAMRFEKRIEELTSEKVVLIHNNNAFQVKCDRLETELARERVLHNTKEEVNSQMDEQAGRHSLKIAKLEGENREQRREADDLARKLEEGKQRSATAEQENKQLKRQIEQLAAENAAFTSECTKWMTAGISDQNAAELLLFAVRNNIGELTAHVLTFADRNGGKAALLVKQPIAGLLPSNIELFQAIMKVVQ